MRLMHHTPGKTSRLRNPFRRYRDDSGSVTVEFVLWVPIFLVILGIMVDVSMMFLTQSNLWQVARDTARQISIRQLTTVTAAKNYAETAGTFSGNRPTATIAINNATQTVTVQLAVPIRDVGVFGVLNIGGNNDLVASVTSRLEPF